MIQNNVIIAAGGEGLRMGKDLPKQFIPIGGKPILMHTIDVFYHFDNDINIVLVLPESHLEYWQSLCEKYHFTTPHKIAFGGKTRFHSVKKGLELVEKGIVGIQDGVRPFGSLALIRRCYDAARLKKAVIPVIPSQDSLREVIDDVDSKIIDRSKIRLIQTPQVFDVEVLKAAYETDFKETFTDDASVVEDMGMKINLVEGEITNIKITTPFDLKIGEVLLQN